MFTCENTYLVQVCTNPIHYTILGAVLGGCWRHSLRLFGHQSISSRPSRPSWIRGCLQWCFYLSNLFRLVEHVTLVFLSYFCSNLCNGAIFAIVTYAIRQFISILNDPLLDGWYTIVMNFFIRVCMLYLWSLHSLQTKQKVSYFLLKLTERM